MFSLSLSFFSQTPRIHVNNNKKSRETERERERRLNKIKFLKSGVSLKFAQYQNFSSADVMNAQFTASLNSIDIKIPVQFLSWQSDFMQAWHLSLYRHSTTSKNHIIKSYGKIKILRLFIFMAL